MAKPNGTVDRLTDAVIVGLRAEATELGRDLIRFETNTGLGVRVSPFGHVCFVLQLRLKDGRKLREKIGAWGKLTPTQARAVVSARAGDIALGRNPFKSRYDAPVSEEEIEEADQPIIRKMISALLRKRTKLDPETTPDLTQLYRHYDQDGVLLYVGVSRSADGRWWSHQRGRSVWLHKVAVMTIDDYSTRKEAEEAEAQAIMKEKPLHNRIVRLNNHWRPSAD
jgi:hypothetical protein